MMKFSPAAFLVLISALVSTCSVQAGVVIGGTRIIYDGNKKEASLSVTNPDAINYLIQSWLEPEVNGADKAPFIVTPPLFRLDAAQRNVLRIVRTGNLPEDRESLYWLSIKSIPSSTKQNNTLQIAVKTRIKLIYRPVSLQNSGPEELTSQLTWERQGNKLKVINPTNYYMNFNQIKVNGKLVNDASYVAPKSSAEFVLPAGSERGKVSWKLISDYGAVGEEHQGQFK